MARGPIPAELTPALSWSNQSCSAIASEVSTVQQDRHGARRLYSEWLFPHALRPPPGPRSCAVILSERQRQLHASAATLLPLGTLLFFPRHL